MPPVHRAFASLVQSNPAMLTLLRDERAIESSWSHPDVPLLVFADNVLPQSSVAFHGGPIGTGLPVQLVFWGAWWNSPDGVARQTLIAQRTQAMIASDYFSELAQYGIARPTYRGAIVVTRPGAPGAFNSDDDQTAVPDLIDALIDDDVFPDPDDGRIAFVVCMPEGFTQSIGANGAHSYGTDYDFPFDTDNFWVAWVRFFAAGEAEDTMRTTSHELVELFTDPEGDGWYADPAATGEIGDAGVSSGTKQTAWVNGVKVQAYWSNRHGATVIPIDRDYRARLRGAIADRSANTIAKGTFRPDPKDSAACGLVRECCIEDRDYTWSVVGHDEVATLRLDTQRYREPKAAWSIGGVAVNLGSGTVTLRVLAQTFTGRVAQNGLRNVTVGYEARSDSLVLRTAGLNANFDVSVACSVTDGSIAGNVRTNVVARPVADVGFVGAERLLDPSYREQTAACSQALRDLFKRADRVLVHEVGPGEPIEFGHEVIAGLPAFARVAQYQEARRARVLARMALAILPEDVARAHITALAAQIPALGASRALRSSGGESCRSEPHGRIVFASDREHPGASNIFAMDADGSNPVNLTPDNCAMSDFNPRFSTDGTRVVFERNAAEGEHGDVVVMNADGSGLVNLTAGSASDDGAPAFSPDGRKIAFYSDRADGLGDIHVMDADGGNPVNLTSTSAAFDTGPSFSPDGTKIAFCSNRDNGGGPFDAGNSDVFVMNADGSDPVNLTPGTPGNDFYPVFSPDGTRIAFHSSAGGLGRYDIYVMGADGSDRVNLTAAGTGDDFFPRFSPDGTQIVFGSNRGGSDWDVYVMGADGSDPVNLTPLGAADDVAPDLARR